MWEIGTTEEFMGPGPRVRWPFCRGYASREKEEQGGRHWAVREGQHRAVLGLSGLRNWT